MKGRPTTARLGLLSTLRLPRTFLRPPARDRQTGRARRGFALAARQGRRACNPLSRWRGSSSCQGRVFSSCCKSDSLSRLPRRRTNSALGRRLCPCVFHRNRHKLAAPWARLYRSAGKSTAPGTGTKAQAGHGPRPLSALSTRLKDFRPPSHPRTNATSFRTVDSFQPLLSHRSASLLRRLWYFHRYLGRISTFPLERPQSTPTRDRRSPASEQHARSTRSSRIRHLRPADAVVANSPWFSQTLGPELR